MPAKRPSSQKQLVIAEKPSVAKDLSKALGNFKQNKAGYFERDDMIISSALGHLVELYMPDDFDAKYHAWSIENLPILPEKFRLKPIESTAERFEFLKKLMQREDIIGLINACDAGREGELIFAYLCELAQCDKPKQRLWLSSMTEDAIRDAFEHLRSSESMQALEAAARCRSEADWLVGINGTRAITAKMAGMRHKSVASVGRVQTPTLALVCEREQTIQQFKPTPFWRIQAHFHVTQGDYAGFLQRKPFKQQHDDDRRDRFWDEAATQDLLQRLQALPTNAWTVEETQKRSKMSPPRLFDLTTLQRECNQRFGFSAKMTLDLAQSLYEKHKALTYPRTDARALPEDYAPTCIATLKKLDATYASLAQTILENQWVNPKQKTIFNNKAISDHFAIIPTGIIPKTLKETEQKVYDCVVRRFLAVFFPPAEFSTTTRLTTQANFIFKTEGKVLVSPGWLTVVRKTEKKETLTALVPEDQQRATALDFQCESDQTRPPARFTEATLLASMEHAGQLVEDENFSDAMKERGLGTPATRAQIIEHLIATHYVERQDKELLPTSKANQLLAFLHLANAQELANPALTGEWEYQLNRIQNGQLSRPQFMHDIQSMTADLVHKIANFHMEEHTQPLDQLIAPSDGKPMLETLQSYRSQDGLISISKTIGGRPITLQEVQTLLEQKRLGPLTGFISKFGKPYQATLVLDAHYKVKFEFENTPKTPPAPIDLSTCEAIGTCPLCKGTVFASDTTYLCENTQKQTCTLRVSRTLLERTIPTEQFVKLLTARTTDLIDRFKSKRTGKFFSAHLVLKKNGDIGFEFEPKPPKESK